MSPSKFNAVLFDLDNTLFDEFSYYEQSFRKISQIIHSQTHRGYKKIYSQLVSEFVKRGSQHPKFFSIIADMYNLNNSYHKRFYEIYQSIDADISLFSDADQTLEILKSEGYLIGIITNGSLPAQKNKINALNLSNRVDVICIPDEFGKEFQKPDKFSYIYTAEELGVSTEECVYVGDNPLTDFEGAKKVGMETIRIRRGEFAELNYGSEFVDHEITTTSEIFCII
jgi:putative hydrolase of the HAD superfamily